MLNGHGIQDPGHVVGTEITDLKKHKLLKLNDINGRVLVEQAGLHQSAKPRKAAESNFPGGKSF